ncbi:MAG: alpha/beta hydrolase [Flavipsychrobacter sp.]|nr:alpha/beta hydrolase [Flavipsychrobacter sp.]
MQPGKPYSVVRKNNVTISTPLDAKGTIIFAHGFGTDQSAWKDVAAAFSSDYQLVLYDNVGGGQADEASYSRNKYDSLHSYVADLLDICAEFDIKDAIMVGHSVSGMISLLAGIKAPQHFAKMILIGATARYLNDKDYVGGFDQAGLDAIYAAMTNNYFSWVSGFAPAAMANPDKPQLAESFAQTLSTIRPDIAQSVAHVIFQSDHRKDLPLFNIETLLLQTKHDIAVPLEAAQYLNNNIKNSILKVVEAEGHFPHISAPAEIIAAIKEYL